MPIDLLLFFLIPAFMKHLTFTGRRLGVHGTGKGVVVVVVVVVGCFTKKNHNINVWIVCFMMNVFTAFIYIVLEKKIYFSCVIYVGWFVGWLMESDMEKDLKKYFVQFEIFMKQNKAVESQTIFLCFQGVTICLWWLWHSGLWKIFHFPSNSFSLNLFFLSHCSSSLGFNPIHPLDYNSHLPYCTSPTIA